MVDIDDVSVQLLADPAFEMPRRRSAGKPSDFLKDANARFLAALEGMRDPVRSHLESRSHWLRELASSVTGAMELIESNRPSRAWDVMEDILDEHLGVLERVSVRHAAKVIGSRSWYRITTWSQARSRRDIFHMPFGLPRERYKSYRFSFAESPAIYLANSVYLCWLECGEPAHATCKIARFEIDDTGWRYLDLPANHASYLEPLCMDRRLPAAVRDPRIVDNSPYVETSRLSCPITSRSGPFSCPAHCRSWNRRLRSPLSTPSHSWSCGGC